MTLQLVRTEQVKDDGEPVQTLGWLYVYNDNSELVKEFATLELPWKGNKNNISCIPPAPGGGHDSFEMELLEDSPSFPYEHYWIKDVPNRSYIKIHRGNYYTQIEGCILIGKQHIDIDGDNVKDVTNSTQSLKELVALVGKSATLQIRNLT